MRRDSRVQTTMAGRPIRFPVEEKGRFVEVSGEPWLKTHTIDSSPLARREEQAT